MIQAEDGKDEVGFSNEILVSIVTIVYNRERSLERTIKSVLAQSYKNIEYIIIDGGSKDRTLDIIQKYSSNIAYWVSEADKGIADAFNKGIKKAKGDIIGIVNADDWLEVYAIEMVVNSIGGNDVLYGNMQCWSNGSKWYLFTADHTALEKEMTLNHPATFVKRYAYEKFGAFDIQYKCAMDYDLLLRFYINGVKFIYIDKVLTNMDLGGLSDTKWLLGCKEVRRIKDCYLPGKLSHLFYFCRQVLIIFFQKLFKDVGLGCIVDFYKQKLSLTRKVR